MKNIRKPISKHEKQQIATGSSLLKLNTGRTYKPQTKGFKLSKTTKSTLVTAAIGLIYFCCKTWFKSHKKNQVNKKAHENKVQEINLKADRKLELEKFKAAHKEKMANQKIKDREDREARKMETERSAETNIMTEEECAEAFRSFSDILNSPDVNVSDLRLLYPFLHIGVDLGVVADNNTGKTTLLNQLALSLALGRDICNLWHDTTPITPMRVLLFTSEVNDDNIKILYKKFGEDKDFKKTTTITEEYVNPTSIITGINRYIETTDSRGLVVIIDNYTALLNRYKIKAIKALNKQLDDLKAKYAKTHPLTIIKVFHTEKDYNPYQPLRLSHVRNFHDSTNTTKNFIGLTSCNEGDNTRILYVFKNKLEPTVVGQYVIRYAGLSAPMYTFDRRVEDITEVLPIRKTGNVMDSIGKRGRREVYSHELLVEMNKDHQKGLTWSQIMKAHGIECDYSNKEDVKNKSKGIKLAMKRHGIK